MQIYYESYNLFPNDFTDLVDWQVELYIRAASLSRYKDLTDDFKEIKRYPRLANCKKLTIIEAYYFFYEIDNLKQARFILAQPRNYKKN